MCGICGKLIFGGKGDVTEDLMNKMTKTLVHRGPDDEGFFLKEYEGSGIKIGFGFRRLSIIDLEGGHQPMCNENGKIWIVFNGQIYNFKELRKDLIKYGHKFKTRSDTEVIIHSYEEFGELCVEKFNGMFAFAIWDEEKRQLFMARDRIGIKPLFYYIKNNSIIFSSEIKAILQDEYVERKVDLEALNCYLAINYVLAPMTFISGVKSLLPGYYLIFKEGKSEIKQYWDLDFRNKLILKKDEYIERIEEHLKSAVKLRLVSDVPLGAFLSGGVDSSTIVSMMKEFITDKLKTFSIGFKEKSYNELEEANYASKVFDTDHYGLIVTPEIEKLLPKLIWFNDEPLGDTSSIPMYFLSELARTHVTVSLSGDGGDENFAGYVTTLADKIAKYYRVVPELIRRKFIKNFVNLLPVSLSKVSFDYKVKQFVEGVEYFPEKSHYWWRVIFSDWERKSILTSDVYNCLDNKDVFNYFKQYFDRYPELDIMDKYFYVDFKTWLADDILRKVDRTSMAHSLEARVPFLDHKFVEFTASIPCKLKLKGFRKKYIFKKSVEKRLPKKILYRKKQGFNSPISIWIKNDLKDVVTDCLSESNLKHLEYLNASFIQEIIMQHFIGKRDNSLKIWGLLNFVMWERIFIQEKKNYVS